MNLKHSAMLAFLALAGSTAAYGQEVLLDSTGDETVAPTNKIQRPIGTPGGAPPTATLPPQNGVDQRRFDGNKGTINPNDLNRQGIQQQDAQAAPQTKVGEFPIIGSAKLLESLSDLDRPLSPEEITAYGAAIQAQMPMSPEMILDFRRRLDESQKAAATPPSGQFPNPITDVTSISLSSNQETPILLTSQDTASVMAFFDNTGEAWPIASFVIGKPRSFQVYAMQEGSNQLAVTPLVSHGFSNIIVSLVGEDRPLVFDVRTNEENTHYRRDFRVDGVGPNAKKEPIKVAAPKEPTMRASDDVMMAFVTGTDIPASAKRLDTDDSNVRAWSYDGAIYLRSTDTIISPPSSKILTGPGQIKAYKIRPTSVALVSSNGSVSKVRISQ